MSVDTSFVSYLVAQLTIPCRQPPSSLLRFPLGHPLLSDTMSSNYSASIPKCPHEQQFYDSHYCSRSRYSSKKNKLLRTIVAGSTARVASALTSTQVIEGAARLSQEMWEVIWAQSGWHERARGAGYPFPSVS
jgi:hypothetical protein